MAIDPNTVAATILAQTVVAADQAAASALLCEQIATQLASFAPLNSPAFTGTPTAPTPAQNDNSTKLSTTRYLDRLLGVANGVPTLDGSGKIPAAQIPPQTLTAVFVVASQAAMLALSAVPGNIAIRTDISNAEFVLSALPASTLGNWLQIGTSPVLSVAGLTGAILATDLNAVMPTFVGDSGAGGVQGLVPAPLAGDTAADKFLSAVGTFTTLQVSYLTDAKTGSGNIVLATSPTMSDVTLTGTSVAPTASVDSNTTQIATAAFVLAQAGSATPIIDGAAAPGTSTRFARQDHIHPSDTSRLATTGGTLTGLLTATSITCTGLTVGAASIVSDPSNNIFLVTDAAGSYLNYGALTGVWTFVTGNAVSMVIGYGPVSLTIAGQGYKPGGGSWADSSDSRIKNVRGYYTSGLDAIKQLQPITYTFKGNDTTSVEQGTAPFSASPHYEVAKNGTQYVGLIAQDVESILPEMVSRKSGVIDGSSVTDLRSLDTTPLIFALINAIKTLDARVQALELKAG